MANSPYLLKRSMGIITWITCLSTCINIVFVQANALTFLEAEFAKRKLGIYSDLKKVSIWCYNLLNISATKHNKQRCKVIFGQQRLEVDLQLHWQFRSNKTITCCQSWICGTSKCSETLIDVTWENSWAGCWSLKPIWKLAFQDTSDL